MIFNFNDEQIELLKPYLVHLDQSKKESVIALLKKREFTDVEKVVGRALSIKIFRLLLKIGEEINQKKSTQKQRVSSTDTIKDSQDNKIDINRIRMIDTESNFSEATNSLDDDAFYAFRKQMEQVAIIPKEENKLSDENYRKGNIKCSKNKLPIHAYEDEIIDKVRENRITLIEGETGCGKTTQVPKMLLKHYKKIIVSLPRRIAAINIAKRVSEELCVKLGGIVGYKVRFEEKYGKNTSILFVTDGILSIECLSGNIINYDVIIIDEFHMRKMDYEYIISYFLCKNLPKLVMMSATINADKITKFFNAGIVRVPKRQYSHTIYYLEESTTSLTKNVCETIKVICDETKNGDILVFLPGISDIVEVDRQIKNTTTTALCTIKLSASASYKDQMSVFEKSNKRKLILSTNIAESSITVDNLVFVIDSGLVKKQVLRGNAASLEVMRISKSEANQRSGRVGRTAPGIVFRMYTADEYKIMAEDLQPEILTAEITLLLLKFLESKLDFLFCMKLIGHQNIKRYSKSMEKLFKLGCIDANGKITDLGSKIHKIPLKTEMSITLLKSIEYDVFYEVAAICSILSLNRLFYDDIKARDKVKQIMIDNSQGLGDHISYLNIFCTALKHNFSSEFCQTHCIKHKSIIEANQIFQQLKKSFASDKKSTKLSKLLKKNDPEKIILSFCEGYLLNVAKKRNNYFISFTTKNNDKLMIHPSSSLYKTGVELVLYDELSLTTSLYMINCCTLKPDMLLNLKKHFTLEP